MKKFISLILIITSLLNPWSPAFGSELMLPVPGQITQLSAAFDPLLLKGIQVDPDDPFRFDFLIDQGKQPLVANTVKSDIERIVRYFFASLTIADNDLWVNLSPFEKERIVSDPLERTVMGQDLLAQDYMLKQITSSLLYPESESGKEFWQNVYSLAQEKYGTSDVPMDTFNKVWIIPDKAVIEVNGNVALIVQSHLKVMLEKDYSALKETSPKDMPDTASADASDISREMTRKIIIPLLEKEVNEGKNFARLRQIYQAMIMATWFKRTLHQSLLGREYAGQNKLAGIENSGKHIATTIWQRYVQSFKMGAFNMIKEEYDRYSGEMIPRKYFSGGYQYDASMVEIANVSSSKIINTLSSRRWIAARFVARPVSQPQSMQEYLQYGRYQHKSTGMIRKVTAVAALLIAGSLWLNPPEWKILQSEQESRTDTSVSVFDKLDFSKSRTYTYYGIPFKGFEQDPVELAYLLPPQSYTSGIKGFYFLLPQQEQVLKNELGPFHFMAGDLNVPLLHTVIKGERTSDIFLREKLAEASKEPENMSEQQFYAIFNEVLKIRNLYFLLSEYIDEDSFDANIRQLIKRAAADSSLLNDDDVQRLNRAVLEAAYPQGIRKVQNRKLGGVFYDNRVAVTTVSPWTLTHEIFHNYWQNYLTDEKKDKFSSFYNRHRKIFREIRSSAKEDSYSYHINSPEEGFTELAAAYVSNPVMFTEFARRHKDIGAWEILSMVVGGFSDFDDKTKTVTLRIYRHPPGQETTSIKIEPFNVSFPAKKFTLDNILRSMEQINAPEFDTQSYQPQSARQQNDETKGGIDLDSSLLHIDEIGEQISLDFADSRNFELNGVRPVIIGVSYLQGFKAVSEFFQR